MPLTRRKFLKSSILLGSSLLLPKISRAADQGHIIGGYADSEIGTVAEVLNRSNQIRRNYYAQYQYDFDPVLGNNSIAAMVAAKNRAADGSELLLSFSPQISIFPEIYNQLPYAPLRDYKPLALLGGYSFLIAVGPAVANTVTDLDSYCEWVKNNRDAKGIGFVQNGSSGDVVTCILAGEEHIGFQPKAYATFSQLATDLAAGKISAGVILTGFHRKLFDQGILRAIATTSRFRHPGYHGIPTCREQGLSALDISGWFGLFINADAPTDTYNKLMYAYQNTIIREEFLTTLQQNLFRPIFANPDEIQEQIRQEQDFYHNTIERYQIRKM